MKFPLNVSKTDRGIRIGVALLCIYIGFLANGLIPNHTVAMLIGVFGLINLFAASLGRCPVYAVCGISTLKNEPLTRNS